MGSYRSSGRGIQVPLFAIANEFIRIHMFTRVHVFTCAHLRNSILRAEPPFWKSCLRPCLCNSIHTALSSIENDVIVNITSEVVLLTSHTYYEFNRCTQHYNNW